MLWARIGALLSLILGTLAIGLSFGLPKIEGPGPELFPRILGLTLVLAGGWLAFHSGDEEAKESGEKLIGWAQALLLSLLFLFAPMTVSQLGLGVSAALAAGFTTWLCGESWLRTLVVAGVLWLFSYLVFTRLLGVPG